MTWKCPSCDTPLKFAAGDRLSEFDKKYRCHVCRIGLRFDRQTDRFVLERIEGEPVEQPLPTQLQRLSSPRE
jgi:hypothetical protein